MKYTIHEDPKLHYGISYEGAPSLYDGDILELIDVNGVSRLFVVRDTDEDTSNCKSCTIDRNISCLNYWFSCTRTHLKQLDTIMEDL